MSGAGHIRQRGNNHEIRYRANGRTYTETIKGGKRAAQARLRELLGMADRNIHPDDPEKLTFGDWLSRWLDIVQSELGAQTFVSYEMLVRTRIAPALGHISLARLSPSDLQRFYTAMAGSGLKASSARRVCLIANAALARAAEVRLISSNPAETVRKRVPRPGRSTPVQVLEPTEVAQLLAGARDSHLFSAILLGIATGARRNEILALQWDHVDLTAGEIFVDEAIVHLGGKISRKAPKNGESRIVTIPAPVVAELRRIKMEQAEALLRLGARPDGTTQVCLRGADGAALTPSALSHGFAVLLQRVGMRPVKFHALRHSHASELLRQGVPVHVAAARLGHRDGGALLLKTYAHATSAAARDAADRIANLFTGNL